MENRIAIERKRAGELYGNAGKGRERFERELERLSSYDYKAIVIEGSLTAVLTPPRQSQMSHRVVINSLVSWSIRYGVHVWFCCTREQAQALTFRILEKFHKQILLGY